MNVAASTCWKKFGSYVLVAARTETPSLSFGVTVMMTPKTRVRGLERVIATQASLTGMLEPAANPIWVFLLLGERPSLYAAAGGSVVLAAIAWHTMAGKPATDLPAPD